ncbi:MAG: hypothetical protein Q8R79_06740 [Legionellaceae bacterium]|nr:hypothetical protein [Legionellaceae bacterium]
MTYLRTLLLTWMFAANAFAINAYSFSPLLAENNPGTLAKQCKQLSLQLYQISSHQSLPVCQANLDGLNVYYASNYISLKWFDKAQEVLVAAIIQIKYALDIGCDDPSDIRAIINGLQSVNNRLNDKKHVKRVKI